jgi:hypothetical protein
VTAPSWPGLPDGVTADRLPDIGLAGRAGAGKDTAAAYLVRCYGYRRLAFADALRTLALEIDPLVDVGRTDLGSWRYSEVIDHFGYEQAKRTIPSVREFLQTLGVACRTVIGPDVWASIVNRAATADGATGPVVVTDVRFPNEIALIREQWGGVAVWVDRPGLPDSGDLHVSEHAVNPSSCDAAVRNDEDSFTSLETALDSVVAAFTARPDE